MIKNVLLCALLMAMGLGTASAQQLPLRSVMAETDFMWNPAMTGRWSFTELGLNYRQDWVGFEGAPRTATLYGQHSFAKSNAAIGGYFMHDDLGLAQVNTLAMTYSYKIRRRGSQSQWSLGLMGGLNQFFLDAAEVLANDPDDEYLPQFEGSKFSPNLGLGLYYTSYGADDFTKSFFFAGLGSNQLLPTDLVFDDTGSRGNLKRAIHANAVVGYRAVREDIFVEPSLWINYSSRNVLDAQFTVRLEKRDAFWTAATLAGNQTVALQVGGIVSKGFLKEGLLRIGAMGSYGLGTFGSARGLGCEFYMAYRFEQ